VPYKLNKLKEKSLSTFNFQFSTIIAIFAKQKNIIKITINTKQKSKWHS